MPEILVQPFGFTSAAKNFRRLGEFAIDGLEVTLVRILDDMVVQVDKVFSSQGRRGGGEWADISDDWKRRKRVGGKKLDGTIIPPGDPRIGHYRLNLRKSLTLLDTEYNINDIDARRGIIRLGSSLPYAHRFAHGDAHQAARPVFKFTKGDKRRWSAWVGRALKKEWKLSAKKRQGDSDFDTWLRGATPAVSSTPIHQFVTSEGMPYLGKVSLGFGGTHLGRGAKGRFIRLFPRNP